MTTPSAAGEDDRPPTGGTPDPGPAPRATILSGVVVTVAAWFVDRLVIGAAWGPARNPFSLDPGLWARWDSFNYLAIAAHGRTVGRCGSPGFPATAITEKLHATWCGTAGWLPVYPWLMRALHVTGVSLPDAGVLVSWLAIAVAIFVVWLGWGRALPVGRSFVLLVLFGLFPGAVYNFALFPTSTALAFVVGAILAAVRERFLTAAVLMTLAGLCYPSAWYASVGLAVGLVVVALPEGRAQVLRRSLWGLAMLSWLPVLALIDQISFGRPTIYFVEQSESSPFSPGRTFFQLMIGQNSTEQRQIGSNAAPLLTLQALIAIAIAVTAVVVAWRVWRRGAERALEVYPALAGVVVVLGMMVSSTAGTWNRSIVLAAPCVVCLRRLNLPVLVVLTAVTALTTALISHYFFSGALL